MLISETMCTPIRVPLTCNFIATPKSTSNLREQCLKLNAQRATHNTKYTTWFALSFQR